MNVPKLRFKEFNGEWIQKKIKNVANVIGGGTPSTDELKYWGNEINWFTPSEIGKTKYVSSSQRKITLSGLNNSSAKLLPKGTILLSSRATVGEASILLEEASTNQGFQSLVVNKSHNNEFIYYLKEKYKKEMLIKAFGSTFLEISKSNVENIDIIIPTLNEQNKIATFLSLLDKKIELQTKKIEDLKLFKKGLYNIVKNMNCNSEYLLSDIVTFENGKGHESIVDENGKYILVNSKFISTEGKVIKRCSEQLCPLKEKDIVMVMSDLPNGKALAKCFYIDENNKYSLNQRVCLLRTNDNVDSKYLFYKINRNTYYLKFDDGVNQTNLKKNDVLNLAVRLPDLKLQNKYSNIMTFVDKKTADEEIYLNKLNELRKGLMQNMFV